MSTVSKKRREQAIDALLEVYEDDDYDNTVQYVRAADIAERDSELSAKMVGSYLPEFAAESPLLNGLVVEAYSERRCGSSLWKVSRSKL